MEYSSVGVLYEAQSPETQNKNKKLGNTRKKSKHSLFQVIIYLGK
jgi:hypothetical protein